MQRSTQNQPPSAGTRPKRRLVLVALLAAAMLLPAVPAAPDASAMTSSSGPYLSVDVIPTSVGRVTIKWTTAGWRDRRDYRVETTLRGHQNLVKVTHDTYDGGHYELPCEPGELVTQEATAREINKDNLPAHDSQIASDMDSAVCPESEDDVEDDPYEEMPGCRMSTLASDPCDDGTMCFVGSVSFEKRTLDVDGSRIDNLLLLLSPGLGIDAVANAAITEVGSLSTTTGVWDELRDVADEIRAAIVIDDSLVPEVYVDDDLIPDVTVDDAWIHEAIAGLGVPGLLYPCA